MDSNVSEHARPIWVGLRCSHGHRGHFQRLVFASCLEGLKIEVQADKAAEAQERERTRKAEEQERERKRKEDEHERTRARKYMYGRTFV